MSAASPSGAFPTKKLVGKYELSKELGRGSFGVVRLGVDTSNGEQVAVKVIPKELIVKRQLEDKVRHEVAVLAALRYKHVVSLRDVVQTRHTVYLVLELVEGGELFTLIVRHKRLPETVARKLFQQLILAIRYCHTQRVAHRDLKPENILLDRDGHVKVNDFGLAKLCVSEQDMLQTKCGSPNYVAPEVIRDREYNGFTADVWSCGVLLFVMISGKHAFSDPHREALYAMIQRGQHREFGPEFSDGAKDLISKILVVDVDRRATLEDIISHPWFAEGFDASELTTTDGPLVEVSAEQQAQAMREVEESSTRRESNDSSAAELETRTLSSMKDSPETMEGLMAALRALGAQPTKSNENSVSGFVKGAHGLVTFLAEIKEVGGVTKVSMSKVRGKSEGFNEIVDRVASDL